MEHVHAPALLDALRDAETHPVMLDRLGVHVVAVLGPPVVAVAAQEVAHSGHTWDRPDVHAPAFGGALHASKTHPITLDTLGAHVVGVLGPLVRWWPPRG